MRLPAFVLVMMLATFAHAQEPSQATSEGLQILKDADAAVAKLQTFSYKARAWAEGAVRPLFPQMEAKVIGMRGTKDKPARFRIDRTDPAATQRIVCDGSEVVITEKLGRRWLRTNLADLERLDTYSLVFLPELSLSRPFEQEMFRGKVNYLRTENFDGIPCQIVDVRLMDGQWVQWTIGARDHLPRRVKRGFRSEQATSGFVLELNDFRAGLPISPGEFQLPSPSDQSRNALPTGWRVANWEISDTQGTTLTSESLRGQVIVLDFWAVWCLECREGMRDIQGFSLQFRNKPVTLLGVNAFERPGNDPVAFMQDNGFTYRLAVDGDALAKHFLVTEPPATYILSPDGRVLESVFGPGDYRVLTDAIQRGLEQLDISVPTSNPGMR